MLSNVTSPQDLDERFRSVVGALATPTSRRAADEPVRVGATLTGTRAYQLFQAQLASRHLDLAARWLRSFGEGYYTIGSAGHEGNAAVAAALRRTDPALLHYRSGGFFCARAMQAAGMDDAIRDVLRGLVASAREPIAGGRHKVFGSASLNIIPTTSTIASHLPRAVGLGFAIERARRLARTEPAGAQPPGAQPAGAQPAGSEAAGARPSGGPAGDRPGDALVVCSFGDASINHASATAAFNTAGWCDHSGLRLPVLFVCEDNGIGVSVRSPRGWVAQALSQRPGLRYFAADGCDLVACFEAATQAAAWVRRHRRPAVLHLSMVRLMGHAGADAEVAYRGADEIAADLDRDPVLATALLLVEAGVATPAELLSRYDEVGWQVRKMAEEVLGEPKLASAAEVVAPLAPRRPVRVARAVAEAGESVAVTPRTEVSSGRTEPEPGFGGGEYAPRSPGRTEPESGFGGGEYAPRSPGRTEPEPGFGGGEYAPRSPGRTEPEPGFGGGEYAPRSPGRTEPEPGFGGGEYAPRSPGRTEPEPGFGGGEYAPRSPGRTEPEPGFGEGEYAPRSPGRTEPEPGFGEGEYAPRSPGRTEPEPGFGGGEYAPRSPAAAARIKVFGGKPPEEGGPLTLAQAINATLTDALASWPQALLFGEDVAVKGGVYGVTKGLRERFGASRVFDTLLDETSILGLALGAGLAGMLPIPEIQYLAYLHNAEDQLRGEAATMAFFSSGAYRNPMVLRLAGLAYQEGFGGHFHNDNAVAVLRDIPGLLLACPARPDDAAALLRTLLASALVDGTVGVFLEPIALYHTRDLYEPGDGAWSAPYPAPADWANAHVPVGRARVDLVGSGADLTILTFGNGVRMSLRAAAQLAESGVGSRVVDLRWLAPLPIDDIMRESAATRRVLVVDETRRSGGVGEGVLAALTDRGYVGSVRRVASIDSFVPLGPAARHVLVSEDSIIQGARSILES
jgi:2-oxoisovalerate dehydrogenase E1 component